MSVLRKAVQGLAWVFSAMIAARLITFASNLVLARLLAPEAFGIVAIPLIVITYFETLGDMGMGAALVRKHDDVEDAAIITFVFNLALGALWGLLMWLASARIAGYFHRPDAIGAIEALALVHPIKAIGNTHDALLLHDLSFKRRALPEIVRALVKAAAAIAFAIAGYGLWALAWGQVVGTLAWVVAQWMACPWRPWRHLSSASLRRARESAREMISFGSQVVGVNVLAGVLHHSDKLIVGRLAGVEPLGFYTQAAKFPEAAITTLTWATGRVTFPAFARSEGSPSDRRTLYLAALRLVALATLPSAVVLALLSHSLVVVALGPKWGPAGPILAALALAACFRALGSHAGDLFKGAGRADLLRNLALIKIAVTVSMTVTTGLLTHSAPAIAWAFATGTLVTSSMNLWVACALIDARPSRILREIAPAAIAGAALLVTVGGAGLFTRGLRPLLDLAIRAPIASVVGGVALWLLSPELRKLVVLGREKLRAMRAARA